MGGGASYETATDEVRDVANDLLALAALIGAAGALTGPGELAGPGEVAAAIAVVAIGMKGAAWATDKFADAVTGHHR